MPDPITNLHTGTETQSGATAVIGIPNNQIIGLFVNVSAVSGTLPSLSVILQHSPNLTDWYDVPNAGGTITLTGLSAVGLYSFYPSVGQPCLDNIRLSWTIGGIDPSFTFSADLGTY